MNGLWFAVEREPVPRKPGETRPVLLVTLDGVKMCTIADFRDDDAEQLAAKVLDRINDAVTHASRGVPMTGSSLGGLIPAEGVG